MTVRWPDFRRIWAFRVAKDIAEDIHAQLDRQRALMASQRRQEDAAAQLVRLDRLSAEQAVRNREGQS